ncbi:arylsulfatase B-like [Diadema antillarum]|uniref:arylsulfatase B-like n=1 Tax=Diadema antillarum TaxID=105358 RepID=UPI003A8C599D
MRSTAVKGRVLAAGLFLLVWCCSRGHVGGEKAASSPPNVVFILADDLGFNDVGYHGRDHMSAIRTPVLDALASEGVKLEKYYVQPICTPSRSQLLTGRYQIHTGLQHGVIRPPQPNALPLDEVTLPQKLKERGYATSMVGKWHLGFYKDAFLPTERGFDSFFGYLSGKEGYYTHNNTFKLGGTVMKGYDLRANKSVVKHFRGHYSTHLFTEKAVHTIKHHDRSKPLFLYIAYQAVHEPLEVPQSYKIPYAHVESERRRTYAGMVSCMDEGIGNITKALRHSGLYNNTVIIFSTDNGGPTQCAANNWPLRGEKGTLWEGGVRGVGFVHSPLLPASVRGSSNHELIHISDWLPTIVAGLAGGSLNGTKPLDGFNMWDTIRGVVPSPRKELLHNIDPLVVYPYYPEDSETDQDAWSEMWSNRLSAAVPRFQRFNSSIRAALRVGDWKIQTGHGGSWKPMPHPDSWTPPLESGLGIVNPILRPGQHLWLFNITADPLEENDLSDNYPEVVAMMLDRLDQYYQDSVPVRYPPWDPRANPALHGGAWGPWE